MKWAKGNVVRSLMKSKKDTGEDYFSKGKPFINSQEQRQSVGFVTNYHLDHEDTHKMQRFLIQIKDSCHFNNDELCTYFVQRILC